MIHFWVYKKISFEPRHEISNNVICATVHTRSLIRAFTSHLNILWVLHYWSNTIWSSKFKRMLNRLVWVYTCQNATLLESTSRLILLLLSNKFLRFLMPFFELAWIRQYSWFTLNLIHTFNSYKALNILQDFLDNFCALSPLKSMEKWLFKVLVKV